jgi:hypothetical protein
LDFYENFAIAEAADIGFTQFSAKPLSDLLRERNIGVSGKNMGFGPVDKRHGGTIPSCTPIFQ